MSHRSWSKTVTHFLFAFFEPELRAWHGEAPLWKAFWGYGVFTSSILALLYVFAWYGGRRVIQQILLPVFAAYTGWILISVWRCAENSDAGWRLFARSLTIAWAVNSIMVLSFLQLDLFVKELGR